MGLVHGALEKGKKRNFKEFLNKNLYFSFHYSNRSWNDFPNANVIVIENANKFGLVQLHQLRGRVAEETGKHQYSLFDDQSLSKMPSKELKF